jgi:vacuolar-type H+-ATPase subunit H
MPKDSSVSTSTAKSASGGEPAASATERAQAMRERLGAQRNADELLAEASQVRGAAAADADVIVSEAETLAEQLLAEAREAADQLTTQAQERADGILARAYYEAEDLQRHTEEERARIREEVQAASRVEIEEFRTRSAGLLDSAEDGLREVLRSLDELRQGPADGPVLTGGGVQRELSGAPEPDAGVAEMVSEGSPEARHEDPEARPLGWLFRASQA